MIIFLADSDFQFFMKFLFVSLISDFSLKITINSIQPFSLLILIELKNGLFIIKCLQLKTPFLCFYLCNQYTTEKNTKEKHLTNVLYRQNLTASCFAMFLLFFVHLKSQKCTVVQKGQKFDCHFTVVLSQTESKFRILY